MRDLRQIRGERVDIFLREADCLSRLLAAGLHRSFPRHHDYELGTEVGEDVGARLPKAIAVCQQHHNGRNAPCHPEHRECSAAPVVAHRGVGFLKQIANHKEPLSKPF